MSKLLMIAAVAFISWVATFSVWIVLADRMDRQGSASAEVANQWGSTQFIAGPVLSIPLERVGIGQTGQRTVYRETLYLFPKRLSFDASVETDIRTRGIYDTPVYTALLDGRGVFDLRDITFRENPDARIIWEEAVLSLHLSDARGVVSAVELSWQEHKYSFQPSSRFALFGESGIHSPVSITDGEGEYPFSFTMGLRGSDALSFLPAGESTNVTLKSDWSSPHFDGSFLPETRTVTEDGFEATWKVASYGRNAPQSWVAEGAQAVTAESLQATPFGVKLYKEVDFYTLVDRTTKYSILFIALTFLTFFMFEMLAGLRIHPIQYLLVGFAIALFYLLLLSFSEVIGFMYAYVLGAVAVTVLITGYSMSVLGARRRAGVIAALLLALYAYLYTLLLLEELALIFGSVLLFFVLALVMFLTRHLDWYSLTSQKK